MLSQISVCSLSLVLCSEGTLRYTNSPNLPSFSRLPLLELGNVVESSAEILSAYTDEYYEKLCWKISGSMFASI